jgi:phosphatidylglycerophosphatase A
MDDTSAPQNRSDAPLLVRFIASGGFSGYSPIVPGTAGSLVGLALYAIPAMQNPITLSIISIIVFFIGVATASEMEKRHGPDPSVVVIDEIVGMWLSLLFLPVNVSVSIVAFVLFRILDTIKPPPIRKLELVPGGWGIMLDDVGAAVYTNLIVRLLLLIFPGIR